MKNNNDDNYYLATIKKGLLHDVCNYIFSVMSFTVKLRIITFTTRCHYGSVCL